jgi:hypothetical protein
MGNSVVAGAVTTIGASGMLLFCQLLIFSEFGLIVSGNTLLSILFTLFFFVPLLMIIGPTGRCGEIWYPSLSSLAPVRCVFPLTP